MIKGFVFVFVIKDVECFYVCNLLFIKVELCGDVVIIVL